ncbi:MAG TPA: hypothetical protein VHH32_03050 [Gemmatimonadales bacterium]|nr:hypothetical protein [Gemmatimonadales bacterium]
MLRLAALLLLLSLNQPTADVVAQDPRLAARLDSVTRVQVEAVLTAAHEERLPLEPLVQKALEGSSKRASGPSIVAAVRTMRADLQRARRSLGDRASTDELVAGAAALRAGATPEMVGRIRRAEPDADVAVPLAVFTDLVAGGMTVDAAWQSVSRLAEEGGDDQDFLDLRERLSPRSPSR